MTAKNGAEDIERTLNQLSTVMQSKLLLAAADSLLKSNQQRITNQTDASGNAFKGRKDRRSKPMFARLVRNMRLLIIDDKTVTVGFTGNMGEVAQKHQEGAIETATASKNTSGFNKPAELKQAIELVRLGFKVGKSKPSTAYIRSNYTISQAAHLIKKLKLWRGELTTSKQQWQIKNEIRTLLGITEDDKKQILAIAVNLLEDS